MDNEPLVDHQVNQQCQPAAAPDALYSSRLTARQGSVPDINNGGYDLGSEEGSPSRRMSSGSGATAPRGHVLSRNHAACTILIFTTWMKGDLKGKVII